MKLLGYHIVFLYLNKTLTVTRDMNSKWDV